MHWVLDYSKTQDNDRSLEIRKKEPEPMFVPNILVNNLDLSFKKMQQV